MATKPFSTHHLTFQQAQLCLRMLHGLGQQPLKVPVQVAVMQALTSLRDALRPLFETRTKLVSTMTARAAEKKASQEKTGEPAQAPDAPQNMEDQAALAQLDSTKVEFRAPSIEVSDVAELDATAGDLAVLGWFLNFSPDVSNAPSTTPATPDEAPAKA